ncbi:hypothetical protein BJY01DRAFT_258000 [Aspergillus pseudoustus]|uniref:F-box domain-containing protein n=1 Tax=Aspergillus pseudoustus TaxID=1810923 RepID=A0ABR4JER3_9EURO
MSFNDLPVEIVLLILENLDTTTVLKTFCLLSPKFRAIAQPLLYREISLSAEDIPLSLLLLCRTITTCPSIAAQVRLLDIDTEQIDVAVPALGSSQRGVSGDDIKLLKVEAQKLKISSLELFQSNSWTTDSIILPLLLISRFPNLRELFITLDPAGLALLTGLAQARTENNTRQSLSCLGSFTTPHLHCFRGLYGNDIEISNITLLLSCLHLSKIEISNYASSFIVNNVPTHQEAAADPSLGSLSVSTVSLHRSSITEADMGTLVHSCKGLDSLYYDQYDSQAIHLNPHQLYSQLSPQRSSLRVLHLSFQDDSFGASSCASSSCSPFTPAQFGSLKELVHLESLTIDQVYLNNEPELPPSLTRLAIQKCQTPIAGVLTYLAELALTGHFPRLQNILLHSDIIYPGRMLDLPRRGATDILFNKACQRLGEIFKGTGITLRLSGDLLASTVRGYAAAFECGQPGVFWPFIYLL